MKNILFRLLLGVLAFLLVFLIGAFLEASLNIKEWGEVFRQVVAMFGVIFALRAITFSNYKSDTFKI